MKEWFIAQDPVFQAFLAGVFTWSITAVGSLVVFGLLKVNRLFLDAMLGFSGGVMLAASYWSLLAPAIEIAERSGTPGWLPPLVGFLAGGAALWVLDKSLPHLHLFLPISQAEGPRTSWERSILLVTAITLHNIPEGLAIGVAFGGVATGMEGTSLGAALALAIGIGIQNFPEGVAVALPLRAEGLSRMRSFWLGHLSAAVEPPAAVLGAVAVMYAAPLLPYALSFAAGAMVYVVVEELIPESQQGRHTDVATISLMLGFVVMMTLDVALG